MISSVDKPPCCIKRNLLALSFNLLLGTHHSTYYTQPLLEDTNLFRDLLINFIQISYYLLYCDNALLYKDSLNLQLFSFEAANKYVNTMTLHA